MPERDEAYYLRREVAQLRREVDRLRLESTALHSQLVEREETLARCAQLGVSLRAVLATYRRGSEPTAQELANIE